MKWSSMLEKYTALCHEERQLLEEKGREYAADFDCLANFKSKVDIGVNPLQVAMIFMDKHYSSIKSYVKLGHSISNETIESRIQDMRNYLFLLLCIIEEQKIDNTQKQTSNIEG